MNRKKTSKKVKNSPRVHTVDGCEIVHQTVDGCKIVHQTVDGCEIVHQLVYDLSAYNPITGIYSQWPFQDPKLEVPTIYKAYIRPM